MFSFSDDLNIDFDRGSSLTCYFMVFSLFCHNCFCSIEHSKDSKCFACDVYHPKFACSESSSTEIAICRL